MWYSGHDGSMWSVGYALSLDGINWYRYPNNPVLTWNNNTTEPKNIITPSVIKDGEIYKMWFTSSFTDHDDGDFTIGYATSTDGINWLIQNYKQLIPSQDWDNIGITHPFVLKLSDNSYYMWYSARKNPAVWTIGLATSSDSIHWTPYLNNPVITPMTVWWERGHNLGPHVIYDNKDSKFKMWYNTTNLGSTTSIAYAESTNGINWDKPIQNNPILLNELPGYFDTLNISDGSVLKVDNSYLLWYGGTDSNGISGIGLAYDINPPSILPTPSYSLFPSVSPTISITPIITTPPTPTLLPTIITSTLTPSPIPSPTANPTQIPTLVPTLIPSPTLSPIPTPIEPIIIIPGMFTSWNKDMMLEGKLNSTSNWKLLSFVKEYTGLLKTLENLGYKDSNSLFIWTYDWRQTIEKNTNQFNNFINTQVLSQHENSKINLIGHSLGGLIARSWAQSNSTKVNHIITIGSPNQGTIQPYAAWEGGDITQDNSFLTLFGKFLVHINKNYIQTDRETIQRIFPVLHDLLPTSSYLINSMDNKEIQKNSMHIWNDWLTTLNNQAPTIYPIFDAIAGSGIQTPAKYKITKASNIDTFLGNWIDGKPIETIKLDGDNTVIQSRATLSDDPFWDINKNHAELIASKEGIDKILQILAINHTLNDIHEGQITSLTPGLIFFLRSPAKLTVTDDHRNEYVEEDGILVIPHAINGLYHATITGTENGIYHLTIGQFSKTQSNWIEMIHTVLPGSTYQYDISFREQSLLNMPITNMSTSDWFDQIETQIQSLPIDKKDLYKLQIPIKIARIHITKKNNFILKIQLEILLSELSSLRKKIPDKTIIEQTLNVATSIQLAYSSLFEKETEFFSKKIRTFQKNDLEFYSKKLLDLLNKKLINNHLSISKLLIYKEAQNNFQIAQTAYSNKEYARAYIYFYQAKLLFDESLSDSVFTSLD